VAESSKQQTLDLDTQCPMCEKWFKEEDLHDEDYLCSKCEGEWSDFCYEIAT